MISALEHSKIGLDRSSIVILYLACDLENGYNWRIATGKREALSELTV